MLIWKICFYFSFVYAICSSKMKTRHVTRDQFTEKVLSRWDNFNSRNPFKYTIGRGRKWLCASRSMKLRSKFRITKMQTSKSSVIVCEKVARFWTVRATYIDLYTTYYDWTLASCIFVVQYLLRNFILLDALNHFLPLPVVYVKGSRELKLSQCESTFSVNRSRVTWRVFIFDEQIAKTKLK